MIKKSFYNKLKLLRDVTDAQNIKQDLCTGISAY